MSKHSDMPGGTVATRPGRRGGMLVSFEPGDPWVVAAEVATDGLVTLHCGAMYIEDMEALLRAAKSYVERMKS